MIDFPEKCRYARVWKEREQTLIKRQDSKHNSILLQIPKINVSRVYYVSLVAIFIPMFILYITTIILYISIQQNWKLKKQKKRLEKAVYYDYLTQIPNRRFFEQKIKKEIKCIQHCQHQSGIILVDVDDFKKINDTYGNQVGDEILRQLALQMKKRIRVSDVIARLGGEEFIILLPRTSLIEAYQVAETLRNQIAENQFVVNKLKVQITASFGVALLNNIQEEKTYYQGADRALYRAKKSGKNKVCVEYKAR